MADPYAYDITDEILGGALPQRGKSRKSRGAARGAASKRQSDAAGDEHAAGAAAGSRRRSSSGSTTSKLAAIRDQIQSRVSVTATARASTSSVEDRVAARLAELESQRVARISVSSVESSQRSDAASASVASPDRPSMGHISSITALDDSSPMSDGEVHKAAVVEASRARAAALAASRASRSPARPPLSRPALSPSDRTDSNSSLDISSTDFTIGPAAARQLAARRASAAEREGRAITSILEHATHDDAESITLPDRAAGAPSPAGGSSGEYSADFADAMEEAAPTSSEQQPAAVQAAPPPASAAASIDAASLSFAQLAAMFKAPIVLPSVISKPIVEVADAPSAADMSMPSTSMFHVDVPLPRSDRTASIESQRVETHAESLVEDAPVVSSLEPSRPPPPPPDAAAQEPVAPPVQLTAWRELMSPAVRVDEAAASPPSAAAPPAQPAPPPAPAAPPPVLSAPVSISSMLTIPAGMTLIHTSDLLDVREEARRRERHRSTSSSRKRSRADAPVTRVTEAASTPSETAAAALAIALRAAASAALAKTLSAAPHGDTHKYEPAPAASSPALRSPRARGQHVRFIPPPAATDDAGEPPPATQSPREDDALTSASISRMMHRAGIDAPRVLSPPPPRRHPQHAARAPPAAAAAGDVHDAAPQLDDHESLTTEQPLGSTSPRDHASPQRTVPRTPPRAPAAPRLPPDVDVINSLIAQAVTARHVAEQEVQRLRQQIDASKSSSPTRPPRSAQVSRADANTSMSDLRANEDASPAEQPPIVPPARTSTHHAVAEYVPVVSSARDAQQAPAVEPSAPPAHVHLLTALAELAVTPPPGTKPLAEATAAAIHAHTHGSRRESSQPHTDGIAAFFARIETGLQAAQQHGVRAFVPLPAALALQREIEVQDAMIATYHNDNERLRAALTARGAAGPSADDVGDAGTSGRARINPSFQRSGGEGWSWDAPSRPAGADAAALRVELNKDAQIVALREELATAHAGARVREQEMKAEMEALRKAKTDLECRLGGVDLPAVKASVAAEDAAIRQLRVQLAEQRARYEEEVRQLRGQVAWYIDNQAIIDADAGTIAAQAATIRDLQARLTHAHGLPAVSSAAAPTPSSVGHTSAASVATTTTDAPPPAPRSASQGRSDSDRALARAEARVKQLQKTVAELQEALRKRNPDSLVSLIHEAKGASGAVGERAALVTELQTLRTASEEAAAAHERRLRALRQDAERTRSEFERRQAILQEQLKAANDKLAEHAAARDREKKGAAAPAAMSRREAAYKARIADLEAEVARLQGSGDAVVSKLPRAASSAGLPPKRAAGAHAAPLRTSRSTATPRVVAPLSSGLRRASSTSSVSTHTSTARDVAPPPNSESAAETEALREHVRTLELQLQVETSVAQQAREEVDAVRRALSEAQDLASSARQDAEAARAALQVHIAATSAGEAAAHESSRDERAPLARSSHADASENSMRHAAPMVQTERQKTLQAQIDTLYSTLQILEARAEARELELLRAERVVTETAKVTEAALRQHYEQMMRAKDAALERAREELTFLAKELTELQQQLPPT